MRRPRYRRPRPRDTARCRRRRGRGRPGQLIVTDNPHAMGPCRDEFGDCAGEGGGGVDGKDGDLVLSVTDSLFEFYDGEEVGACRAEEMGGGGTGDVLDVDHGDVAYETFLVVDDGDGGDAAGGHGLEGG